MSHASSHEQLGDPGPQPVARRAVLCPHCEERGVQASGIEPERGHSPFRLSIVETVALEVFEQVASQAKLGLAHRASPGELEAERCLAGVEHQQVVLAEWIALALSLEARAGTERQFERVRERGAPAGVTFGDGAAVLVEQREGTPEMPADDREQ